MTNYRKASAINLVVGIVLILFGVGGMAGLNSNTPLGANLFWAICFILVFIFLGGYEIGKYAEMRHEGRKKGGNLKSISRDSKYTLIPGSEYSTVHNISKFDIFQKQNIPKIKQKRGCWSSYDMEYDKKQNSYYVC